MIYYLNMATVSLMSEQKHILKEMAQNVGRSKRLRSKLQFLLSVHKELEDRVNNGK